MRRNMKKEVRKNPGMVMSEYFLKKGHRRLAWGWWVAISLVLVLVIIAILGAMMLSSWN
jgi:hypothetical protein